MKKIFKALKFPIIFILFLSSFIACDKDFNVLKSNVLGEENANFITGVDTLSVSAYNRELNALQINNLASNLLGVFNDPDYGKTLASIVTQVTPTSFTSASSTTDFFGETPVIDSVVINIPYYSTVTGLDDDGNSTYTIDSLYGDSGAKIKLSIYQNNYFLLDFDPNTEDNSALNYYSNSGSNENSVFSNSTDPINFDDHTRELLFSEEITPSASAVVITTVTDEVETETRSVPALRIALDNLDFWKTTIIDKQNDTELRDATTFKNYFRGLYFKVEEASIGDGNMFLLNLASSDASITMYYTAGETDARIQYTYVLSFLGNRLNTFINDYDKVSFPTNPNTDLGDKTLYLKGAEGSMAIIDLFSGLVDCDGDGNINDSAIDCFKKAYRQTDDDGEFLEDETTGDFILKRLISEAHLEIYEDDDKLTDIIDDNDDAYHKYDRLYAYDVKNNIPTVDYLLDGTSNTTSPFSSSIISLSQRDSISPTAGKYKIRLTEHLNNILYSDSTNTQIGLVLSTNVNYTTNAQILNSDDDITEIPAAAIITPRGTILHGSNSDNDDQKLNLKIFFTEPKDN